MTSNKVKVTARINEQLLFSLNSAVPNGNVREKIEFVLKHIKDGRFIFLNEQDSNFISKLYGINNTDQFFFDAIYEKLAKIRKDMNYNRPYTDSYSD